MDKVLKYIKSNVIICLIIAVVVLSFVFYKADITTEVQTPPTLVNYTDPGNHFTVTLPSNWKVKSDYGNEKTGIGTENEQTSRVEFNNLASGYVGLNVTVYEKKPVCNDEQKPNTTFAGLPAYFNQKHYSWIIKTTDSTIVVGYYYPGLPVFRLRNGISVPQSEMDKNSRIIKSIISTFKFNNAKPLVCP